jgi:hypothetical protein
MIKKILYVGLLFITGCSGDRVRREYGSVLFEKGIVETSTYTPGHTYIIDDQRATYVLIFKGPFGKFHVEDKQLWETLSVGDSVTIEYREVFLVRYINNEEISRTLDKNYGKIFVKVKND